MSFNGTANGTIAYATGKSGFGQCLSLTNAGYVSIPTISGVTSIQTIEGWFNTTAAGSVSCMVSAVGWYVAISGGKIVYAWNALTQTYASTASVNDGAWHSFALVWSSGTIYCFLDGQLLNTSSAGNNTAPFSNFGAYNGNLIYSYTGKLDEVRCSAAALYTANYTPSTAPFAASNPNQSALYHFEDDLTDSNVPITSVVAGSLTRTLNNYTSMIIATTVAIGGTAPFLYQFQRAPDVAGVAGTYATIGANSSATSIVDSGLTNNTKYWYRCVVTDNLSQTSTSAAVSFTSKDPATFYVGGVGNSIMQGYQQAANQDPITTFARLLGVNAGIATKISVVNAAIVASQTSDWMPGSGNYVNAVAAFKSAGVDYVHLMLGTNDSAFSVSTATSLVNMTAIVNGLVGQGFKVFLHYDPYPNDARTTAQYNLLVAFQSILDSLCNGTTIIQGDKSAYALFQANASANTNGSSGSYLQGDGLHPNEFGAQVLAQLWGYPFGLYTGIIQAGISGGIAF